MVLVVKGCRCEMAYYSHLVDCSCVYGDFLKNLKPQKPWKNLKLKGKFLLHIAMLIRGKCLYLNIILMTLFVTGALFLLVV